VVTDAAAAMADEFLARGWLRFAMDPAVRAWAAAALPAACAAATDPVNAHWLRCGGTWFVGVDTLPNDASGRVTAGPPLTGAASNFITEVLGCGQLPLHRAQVSVCYPGYPQPMPGESESGFRFRREHDAAHVDGLLAEGPARRRFLREPHAYILGLPLAVGEGGASPPVLWEGSHLVMRSAFQQAFAGHGPDTWRDIDLTAIYAEARRTVFSACRRVVIEAHPGEAILFHRHLLHGMAPWADGAIAPRHGRVIAYFRPQFARFDPWLDGARP
jgi:hypothetical protein